MIFQRFDALSYLIAMANQFDTKTIEIIISNFTHMLQLVVASHCELVSVLAHVNCFQPIRNSLQRIKVSDFPERTKIKQVILLSSLTVTAKR